MGKESLSRNIPQIRTGSHDKQKELFMQCAKCVCPEFVVTDTNRKTIAQIFNYAIGKATAGIDLNKGIYLHGPIGSGKSTLLEIMRDFMKLRNPRDKFGIWPTMQVCLQYTGQGLNAIGEHATETRGYDELGVEPVPANHYGTQLNVFEQLLQWRYNSRKIYKTHITSNLPPEFISQLYGARVADRSREMFNFIQLDGPSFRK